MDILILIIGIVVAVLKSKKNSSEKMPKEIRDINQNTQRMRQQHRQQVKLAWEGKKQVSRQQTQQNRQSQQSVQSQIDKQRELKRRLEQKYKQPVQTTVSSGKTYENNKKNNMVSERAMEKVQKDVKNELKQKDANLHQAEGNVKPSSKYEKIEGETLLDEVYDLIVTGYSGELKFDRDFLSEGMDMLNQISG